MPSEMYEVLRAVAVGNGDYIMAGTIVDASGWRNTKALVNAGRLRLLPAEEVAPKPAAKPPKPKATPKKEEEVTDDVNI